MANKDAKRFTFGNQVCDNMFWTLFSGVTIWTGFEILLLWAKANDIGYWFSFSDNPILFIGLFIVIPSWNSFWFFCIHRALHWPPLYRIAHHVHHRNVSVGPWSGNAMHPLEHLIWMAGALIYIPLACHPVHFLFSQRRSRNSFQKHSFQKPNKEWGHCLPEVKAVPALKRQQLLQ